jgi:hypothetical protein
MKSTWKSSGTVSGLGLLVAACGVAQGAVQVIYTKIPTSPTSLVPGARDLAGAPVVTNFRAMEILRVSPDGNHWVLVARNQLGSDLETMVLKGAGVFGAMFAQEGQPIPGGAAGELYDFFGSLIGRFNANNDFAFSARARGGVASTFQKVLHWNSVTGFTIRFQMGDLISGLSDTGTSGDEIVGNSVSSIHLFNDGRIGAHDLSVGNIASARRPVLMYKAAGPGNTGAINGFKQSGVDTVTAFGGVGISLLTGISDTFLTTPDGAHWGVTGTVNPGGGNVAFYAFDGAIRLQAGQALPSSALVASTFVGHELTPDGSWHVRGGTGAAAYAVRDDVLIAAAGSPITTGSTETWVGTAFTAFNGNNAGDFMLAGKSNNADPNVDDVIVINNNRVILREGDPVDVNGNGLFDDNAFVGRGNNTVTAWVAGGMSITANREVFAIVNLKDGAGVDLNSNPVFGAPNAFVKITWCHADLDNDGLIGNGGLPDGGVDVNDLLFFLSAFEAGSALADLDNDGDPAQGTPDGGVDVNDLLFFLARFEAGC